MIKRVVLINAPNDVTIHKSGSASYYPHLGLLSIGTYIQRMYPAVQLEIADGSITPLANLLERTRGADLVGISVLTPTYGSAVAIARCAKSNGAIVVFGNDHATNLWRQILVAQSSVDYIVCGDFGEVPLFSLITALNGFATLNDVPNLAWRNAGIPTLNVGNGAIRDPKGLTSWDMNQAPIPDRRLIQNESVYLDNYARDYGLFHEQPVKQTTINIARGCAWGASIQRRCTFCDIYDLTLKANAPERVWAEVQELVEMGYSFLYEVCDSFSSFAVQQNSVVDKLIASRPKNLKMSWFAYCRATELARNGVVDKLKAFGVTRVNVGLDGADDAILRGMSKGATREKNAMAVSLCNQNRIQMYVSFVFGSVGESRASLEDTVSFIEDMLQSECVVAIDPSVLLPLPNSPAWRYLMSAREGEEMRHKFGVGHSGTGIDFVRKYGECDFLPTNELAEDWVAEFCNCSYTDIIWARDRLLEFQKERPFVFGGFGVRGF